MRRLTLILSDLYLQDEAARDGIPQTHSLPAFAWLLRYASGREHIRDWREWLLSFAGGTVANLPQAFVAAQSLQPTLDPDSTWLATPVRLEARLDHVRLVDRGLLTLDPGETAAWCEDFARVFGPEYALHECNERAFILSGLPATPVSTHDPARLLGAEIGPALPGREAGDLRRLWAEIEMWLHACPLNDLRSRAGRPRISALWIWGNRRQEAIQSQRDIGDFHLQGGDPVVAGLRPTEPSIRRASTLSEVERTADHVVAEFATLIGQPDQALPWLETHWFAPARQSLESGQLARLQLVANDLLFTVKPRAGWRFWRRRRTWLESLA